VFIYSTPIPEVEIYIKEFQIHPNAVARGGTPKPKLRKLPALKALMARAYQKAQKNQQHSGSNDQTKVHLNGLFASQHDQPALPDHPPGELASQHLLSQAPSYNLHGEPKDQGHSHTTRASLGYSKELLLARLADSKSTQNNAVTRTVHDIFPASLGGDDRRQSPLRKDRASMAPIENLDLSANTIAEEPSDRRLLKNADDLRAINSIAKPPCADTREGMNDSKEEHADSAVRVVDDGVMHKIARSNGAQHSKKRHCESTGTPSPSQTSHVDKMQLDGPQNLKPTSPPKKRQRTDAGQADSLDRAKNGQSPREHVSSLADVQKVDTKTVSAPTVNPWEGMTTIPKSEIEIPKDQEKLLSELKWIPQATGVSTPLCHVPPRLLSQWNDIARKRQSRAETPGHILDCPLTPPPHDPNPSINGSRSSSSEREVSEWEASPVCSPQKALPPDSSPVRKDANHKAPTMTGAQDSASQPRENNDVEAANAIQIVSQTQSARSKFVISKDVLNTASKYISRSASKGAVELAGLGASAHAAGGNLPEDVDSSNPVDIKDESRSSSPMQEQPHCSTHSENDPDVAESQDEQSGCENEDSDDDDDDDMETSVPFALGQSVPLSSMPEQGITSSGPPLPRLNKANVQVVETPIINTTRPHHQSQNGNQTRPKTPSPQKSTSRDVKNSSSSRVLDTYRSQDSQRQSDLSQDVPNTSLPELDNDTLRVDVVGTQTQTSSIHVPSQGTQSSSDAVLDSSRPIQRQRGSSIFHLDPSDDASSFPYASPHLPSMSHPSKPSQCSTSDQLNLDGASQVPESPSDGPRTVPGDNSAIQESPQSPNVEVVVRRRGFIGKDNRSAEAQTIYEKFRNAYSPYLGDFSHFTEMCSKLHTIRNKGFLQRSFLWDDFIILSLEKYPQYFERHSTQHSKPLDYEEFFCSSFSRPQYKKRSLTAHEIDVAASQYVPLTMASPEGPLGFSHETTERDEIKNEPMQGETANISFTASLVDKFSDLRARSLGHTPVGHPPNSPFVPVAASGSFASIGTGSNETPIKREMDDSPAGIIGSQTYTTNSIDQKPPLADLDSEMVDPTQSDTNHIRLASSADNVDMAEDDVPEADEADEVDTTHHETASIELGDDADDRHASAFPAPDLVAASADSSDIEPPRQRRTWFRSLKNIFPTGPVWSDDPNTPFKHWARQDQNLLQEINRRGGTQVLLDKKGVIHRPTYNREAKSTR
jgi:hypothetical protein